MPGWHDRTKALAAKGDIQVVGLIQEQHPDRCRLFQQWHEMDWPVLVDSLNRLGVSRVPYTFLIDQHGIIRFTKPGPADLETFLSTDYTPTFVPKKLDGPPDLDEIIRRFEVREEESTPPEALMEYGDALYLRGRGNDIDQSILAYGEAARNDGPPAASFRLGVALRRRHESDRRRPGDFQAAIHAWKAALDREPNQYIWRRRIQQYGPRPDQPYPFYTWVDEAREAIRARGEEPRPLLVEPSGAEMAGARREAPRAEPPAESPDPDGRISRDEAPLVRIEIAVAPATDARRKVARAHVILTPNAESKGHWNNEAGDTIVWLDPPEGVRLERRAFALPKAAAETSVEPRRMEFEADLSVAKASGTSVPIHGYVLYYVCEGASGECLYLRQDFVVEVPLP